MRVCFCASQFTESVVNLKFDEEPRYEAYMRLFEPLCGPNLTRPILTEGAAKVGQKRARDPESEPLDDVPRKKVRAHPLCTHTCRHAPAPSYVRGNPQLLQAHAPDSHMRVAGTAAICICLPLCIPHRVRLPTCNVCMSSCVSTRRFVSACPRPSGSPCTTRTAP